MNISLPQTLKTFVDEQTDALGFGTTSEYVRDLIRKDLERQNLRSLILDGAQSAAHGPADASYFDNLRAKINQNPAS